MKNKSILIILLISLSLNLSASSKREFRGVWIQTAFQPQYQNMDEITMKNYFIKMLDVFYETGFNAVIFQVRPSADAFFKSEIEPWSKFMTGERGKSPATDWDPMEFMIDECHARNMEFHAWINPYRVTVNSTETLDENSLYNREPSRFVKFDGKIFFDPGQPQNRTYIKDIVKDIVTRYDIDAIHMDDYFYPYPVAGYEFNDRYSFDLYSEKMGFKRNERDDWRRQNVNILIKYLNEDIKAIKPWVRFGISPFGIYRNESSCSFGSKTYGLQNYDDLYADILRWSDEGWIDYVIPQLYWEIGYKVADYKTLIKWWNEFYESKHLYIGQNINRSLDNGLSLLVSDKHLDEKISLSRDYENVLGNCFWYGSQILENNHGIQNILKDKLHKTKALIPAYTNISKDLPQEVKNLKTRWKDDNYYLTWQITEPKNETLLPKFFCVYRFPKGVDKDLNNAEYLLEITNKCEILLPFVNGKTGYTYVITTVDRVNNESKKGVSKKIKL